MHTRIVLLFIIIIMSAFFYLHTLNPVEVKFVITERWTFVLPVTIILFAGFVAGVVVMVVNSLFVDAKRLIRDVREKRKAKALEQAEKLHREGADLLFRGKYDRAVEVLKKAFEMNPANRATIVYLADAYIRASMPEKAASLIEEYLSKNPSDVEMLVKLSCAVVSRERKEKVLKEILSIDDINPHAVRELRNLKLEEGEPEEALLYEKKLIEYCERHGSKECVERQRDVLKGLYYEAAEKLATEGKLHKAVELLKEGLKLDEGFVPYYVLLGECYLKLEDREEARRTWQSAFERTGHCVFLMKLEDIYMEESSPDGMLSIYREAVEKAPANVSLKLLLSRFYLRLEMVDDAIAELEAIETDDTPYRDILLAEAYLRRNQPERAISLFETLIAGDDLIPIFICTGCGQTTRGWAAKCSACNRWNTLRLEGYGRKATAGVTDTSIYKRVVQ